MKFAKKAPSLIICAGDAFAERNTTRGSSAFRESICVNVRKLSGNHKAWLLNIILTLLIAGGIKAQTNISGRVFDAVTKDPLIGASVVIEGTTGGTVTDFDGAFVVRAAQSYPLVLNVSYIGYGEKQLQLENPSQNIEIFLSESTITTEVVEVTGQRISEKQKANPLTVESLDVLAIKETPAASFYDGLGNLKGVDLTAASLGFKVINTRGFNSTSPVRSLQLIDGVDNQSPGSELLSWQLFGCL